MKRTLRNRNTKILAIPSVDYFITEMPIVIDTWFQEYEGVSVIKRFG